jgi:predicted transcriptional regulator
MTYLITIMAKSDIFKSENVEIFIKLRKKFKITFNIIKNLEEEIAIESTIKDVNLNTFISKESTDDNKLG